MQRKLANRMCPNEMNNHPLFYSRAQRESGHSIRTDEYPWGSVAMVNGPTEQKRTTKSTLTSPMKGSAHISSDPYHFCERVNDGYLYVSSAKKSTPDWLVSE